MGGGEEWEGERSGRGIERVYTHLLGQTSKEKVKFLPVLPEDPVLLETLVGQDDLLNPVSQAVQFCQGDLGLHLSQESQGYPRGGGKEERREEGERGNERGEEGGMREGRKGE